MSKKLFFVSKEVSPAAAATSFTMDLPSAENIIGHQLTGVVENLAVAGEAVLGITYQAQAYDPEVAISGTAVAYYSGRLQFHATAKYDPASYVFDSIKHEFLAQEPFDILELINSGTWYKMPGPRYQNGDRNWKNRLGRILVELKAGDADLSNWTFRLNCLMVE